jgi:hypothetical protein
LGKYFADATDEERPVLDTCLNGLRDFFREAISSFGDRLFDQQYRNPTLHGMSLNDRISRGGQNGL